MTPSIRCVVAKRRGITRPVAALPNLLQRIEAANEPSVLAASADDALMQARGLMYRHGLDVRPLIDDGEHQFPTIPRGSLSDEERDRMQEHVTQSFLFLREIPWQPTPWPNVADLAYGHREHLDGTRANSPATRSSRRCA